MQKNSNTFQIRDIPGFFKSKLFGHTLLRWLLVVFALWLLHSVLLRLYTNHGQKIKMPKYIGVLLSEAIKHADHKDFQIVVSDSIFRKSMKGGVVISQIPLPGSMVKEGRTIYVTTTKYRAEALNSGELPVLYGKRFEFTRKELYDNFELNSRIQDVQYDPGPEQHILKVFYHGKLLADAVHRDDLLEILRGDTLDFVLSTQSGGTVDMPLVLCMNVAEAKFVLNTYKLELADLEYEGEITDEENAFVTTQFPKAGQSIQLGTTVQLKIQQTKPNHCD